MLSHAEMMVQDEFPSLNDDTAPPPKSLLIIQYVVQVMILQQRINDG